MVKSKEKFRMIDVNGMNYKLKLTTQNNSELGRAWGNCHYDKLKIFLDKNVAPELRIRTLYHECAHAICEATYFNDMLQDKFGDNGYEIFIDKLGEVIHKFIMNNDFNDLESFVKDVPTIEEEFDDNCD